MLKRITIILFSIGLIVIGAYGFRKLNYWERSAWIFKISTMEHRFEGRSREAFEGRRGQGTVAEADKAGGISMEVRKSGSGM